MFKSAPSKKLTSLACIGYVSEIGAAYVGELKPGKVVNYVVQPIQISPRESGRKQKIFLAYRPEWLEAGFDPSSLSDQVGGTGMEFVYRNNICNKFDEEKGSNEYSLSALQGLAVNDDNFRSMVEALQALPDKSPASVQEVLTTYLLEKGEFGYVLKQGSEVVGEDDNGKKIRELTDNYEIASWGRLNDKWRKGVAKSADNGKLKLTFEI